MDSFTHKWSVRKLIDRCSRRPADAIAWREFVRRFHMAIQGSVSNILSRLTDNDGANRQPSEEVIDHLVNGVYRRLVENHSAALRLLNCTTANSMNGYLLLVSIKVVQDYLRHRNKDARYRSAALRFEDGDGTRRGNEDLNVQGIISRGLPGATSTVAVD